MTTKAELEQFGDWMAQLGWLDRGMVARHQRLWINANTGKPYVQPTHTRADLTLCASEVAMLSFQPGGRHGQDHPSVPVR